MGCTYIYDQNENSVVNMKKCISQDKDYLKTIQFCRSGKNPRVAPPLGEYLSLVKNHFSEISLCDSSVNSPLVFYSKYIIPPNMRKRVLDIFHMSH